MRPIRLRSDVSFALLLADLVVLGFTMGIVLDPEAPWWLRVIFGGVAMLAVAFAARTTLRLGRRLRNP